MAKRALILFSALVFSLGLYALGAQQPATPQQPNPDRIEDAHQGLLAPKPNTGEEAARITNEVAKGLPDSGQARARIPRKNFIDEFIFARIEKDSIPHAALSTDEEFVRRVYLDATGLLPTAQQVRDFVANKDAAKRDKLIDSLIGTEEFTEQFAWFWGDLFRLGADTGYGKNAFQFWIKEWLRLDRPYNEVVFDMLTPSTKAHNTIPSLGLVGRANDGVCWLPSDPDDFRVTNRLDVLDIISIENGRVFLGINTTCISCHDGARHLESINLYLSQRKRIEFHNNAAFFGQMRSLTTYMDNDDQIIDDLGPGYRSRNDAPFSTPSANSYPRNANAVEPAFLLTGEKPRPGADLRAEYVRMLTSNIQFARATVNLLWGRLMTVGFVEPYDGFDLARIDPNNPPPKPWTIQPNNPELLEAMARDFQKSNFSIQHVIRTIMKSNAYQLSAKFPAEWKDSYTPYYARKYIRFLTGPEVADAIATATNRPLSFTLQGVPMTRLKQLTFPGDATGGRGGAAGDKGADFSALLQAFFQGSRLTQSPDGNRPTTFQALMMTGLDLVNSRVLAEKESRVQLLLDSAKSNDDLIEELFLSALARRPTPAEREVAQQALEKDRKRGAENIQWSVLNSKEFVLNH
jgi:hypothetical protein